MAEDTPISSKVLPEKNCHHQGLEVESLDVPPSVSSQSVSNDFDDDGRLKRTGTVWTTSAHIITAVIGSGVLSLAWSMAQLGWVAGTSVMLLFAFVTYYTSIILSACYRTGDGKRNHTYMEAVKSNLGGFQVKLCGAIQYLNLVGTAIGYTIAASISMVAIEKSNCFHSSHHRDPCKVSSNLYMIMFGVVQIFFSQIPDFHRIWWLSIVAAVMSFTYSMIGLGLGVGRVGESVISMLMPFFNDVVGILGAIGFWPLTVYFPVEMYIVQTKIQKWSRKWICLQMLSVACLIISIAAAAGSVAGVVTDLKTYTPFKTSY
ncbi:OLC1v1005058C1 [Oldenlandia corymbosa var. corymbosa]|uniref:OLC1v1005058C1 n=1 Tax=Oldenlandia corymbosa var. corymbosa TaxID=529605 RepID=A0AAV1DDY9_OLDCO|nr:OLC1v1005058C1 [Oldenlandia corymbosa var. corymbosa]